MKEIIEQLKEITDKIITVNAVEDAKTLGNIRTVNSIMLGTLSNFLPFDINLWKEAIKSSVPKKTIDINLKAFIKGREYKR